MGATIEQAFQRRLVPVIVVHDIAEAETVGTALLEGGLPVAEVTLRTPGALAAIRRLAQEPGLLVGAGTVLDAGQVDAAVDAGAKYLVSPGLLDSVITRAEQLDVPLLPGAVTASEAMRAREHGFRIVKFFPAGTSGGARAIAALAAPLGDMRFVPTGGVSPANLADYLAIPAVPAVGGSWMLPPAAVASGDTSLLIELVREAVELAAPRVGV